MQNRIIVTVDNPEDFKRVLGTLAAIQASFSVERINEVVVEEKKRSYQKRTTEGKSVNDIILDEVSKGPATRRQITQKLIDVGFNANSLSPSLTTLRRDGLVRVSGDMVYPSQGITHIGSVVES